ncbi:MAG: hypothetical protein KGO02_15195 [Alphaproteobacteria bacterium]|nr:hypothetical protein [Alphaproteobacteria bacterium]
MFPTSVRREVVALLIAKFILLSVLYVLFFSPSHRLTVTTQRLEHHLFADSAS